MSIPENVTLTRRLVVHFYAGSRRGGKSSKQNRVELLPDQTWTYKEGGLTFDTKAKTYSADGWAHLSLHEGHGVTPGPPSQPEDTDDAK